MASKCKPDPYEDDDEEETVTVLRTPATHQESVEIDYDLVEEPSQDFFCPVSLELLIDPHQTLCCGNHLSQEAASRLQRDGKPCPMCKQPQVSTIPDKFFKRRVNEIMVRCPHKKSGCEWVGGVSEVKQHSNSCPKRPWQCQHCEFVSTYEVGVNKHLPTCTNYPVLCPNLCETSSMPRCELEAHLMVCPLQPVTCEYAEVGCDVKVPRRDLGRHMKEGQQQHLLSATLLNLRLTRKAETSMAELKQELATKDDKINKLTQTLAVRDQKIVDLQNQLTTLQAVLESKMATLEDQAETRHKETHKKLDHLSLLQGFTVHEFTLSEFKKCQTANEDGDWFSDYVYSRFGGYKFQLNIETNGGALANIQGRYMSVRVRIQHESKSAFPAIVTIHVQLLNQLGDYGHHETRTSVKFTAPYTKRVFPEFIKLTELGLNAERRTQYLKDDCLLFQVHFKAELLHQE